MLFSKKKKINDLAELENWQSEDVTSERSVLASSQPYFIKKQQQRGVRLNVLQ